MQHKGTHLKLTSTAVVDGLGEITLNDISLPENLSSPLRLKESCTPMLKRLWKRALADVDANIVEWEGMRYFGAGAKFGVKVFTRDIAYSGVLGLNRTHPEIMRSSLRFTRDLRLKLGFKMPAFYDLGSLGISCELVDLDEKAFIETYRTHSIARRSDDVIWLWAYTDLLGEDPGTDELRWMYGTGKRCFEELYAPFLMPRMDYIVGKPVLLMSIFRPIKLPDIRRNGR